MSGKPVAGKLLARIKRHWRGQVAGITAVIHGRAKAEELQKTIPIPHSLPPPPKPSTASAPRPSSSATDPATSATPRCSSKKVWQGIDNSIVELAATIPIHYVIADGIEAISSMGAEPERACHK